MYTLNDAVAIPDEVSGEVIVTCPFSIPLPIPSLFPFHCCLHHPSPPPITCPFSIPLPIPSLFPFHCCFIHPSPDPFSTPLLLTTNLSSHRPPISSSLDTVHILQSECCIVALVQHIIFAFKNTANVKQRLCNIIALELK